MSRGIRCDKCGAFRYDGNAGNTWIAVTPFPGGGDRDRHFCSRPCAAWWFAPEDPIETPGLPLEGTRPLPLERKGG